MSSNWKALVFAGVLAAAGLGQAAALPLSVAGDARSPIVKVHGCHHECRFSERLGWHNHSNAECRPEPCRQSRGGPSYDSGPRLDRRGGGHECHRDCRYDDRNGWHNHSNAECRPEPCRGRR